MISISRVKIIPCSGIGKVVGLLARETSLMVTDLLAPQTTQAVCLAHLVTGDDDAVIKVNGCRCITIDGCPAMCAAKSVEAAGGVVAANNKYRVIDEMRNHKGKKPGDATALTQEGWDIVDLFAGKIALRVEQIIQEEKDNG